MVFLEKSPSARVIAAEVQHGRDGRGHDLGITYLALRIFIMVQGF
jgi:hypothetical protein